MNRIAESIRLSLRDIYPPEETKALVMMICCDVLNIDAVDVYTGKDTALSESDRKKLEDIVSRLRKNEPIQYILGYADFCGSRFHVAPGVLIPRPETAELVELVAREAPDARRVLDIGTGSGCVAISLSKKLPSATVHAWDVSEEALAIARRNGEELAPRVIFEKRDVLRDEVAGCGLYDVIVSNPPYVMEEERASMSPNVLEWEPECALFVPDNDPLLFYRRISEMGRRQLAPGGKLYLEINQRFGREVARLLEDRFYGDVRVIKDFFGNDRIVTANLNECTTD